MSIRETGGHRLLQLGVLLFLLGLLTGFAGPATENMRMALTSHLEGILNGILLVVLGLLWPRLRMGAGLLAATFWLAIYGSFANWAATLLAAVWGAGGAMMPIAAGGHSAGPAQEGIVSFLLLTLSAAMILVSLLVLWGLRQGGTAEPAARL